MNRPSVVNATEWRQARLVLLEQEKESVRQRDALAASRRALPMVRVEGDYKFTGPNGPARLSNLFGPQPQLIVYHFMFDPSWSQGCKSCSFLTDGLQGTLPHLAAAHTAVALVSRAPQDKLEAFRRRMGWTMPWYSSQDSRFNYDFQASLEGEPQEEYNFRSVAEHHQHGAMWIGKGEMPGLSVFLRDGDAIYRTYSAYSRGLDILLHTFNYLDLTPLGRQEVEGQPPMGWVRHHDLYPA